MNISNPSAPTVVPAYAHGFQCQWTLSFENGSIQVAGREFDEGVSTVSIVGGTGIYAGIRGDMTSVNNNDGTFTQMLRYSVSRILSR